MHMTEIRNTVSQIASTINICYVIYTPSSLGGNLGGKVGGKVRRYGKASSLEPYGLGLSLIMSGLVTIPGIRVQCYKVIYRVQAL